MAGIPYDTSQLEIAVAKAPQSRVLDSLFQLVTNIWSQDYLTDSQTRDLYEKIESRRLALKEKPGILRNFRRRLTQRSPNAEVSRARRRRRAAYAPLSPRMAENFTTTELSILGVIADQVRERGALVWAMEKIASIAGCCRSMVQKTLAKAERLGYISVKRTRIARDRNALNEVRITCIDWLAWIAGRGGSKKVSTTYKQDLSLSGQETVNPCISREVEPYIPQWKRLISRTSPGALNTLNPLRV